MSDTTPPTIGVCGYGRCGTTMVMSMLIAGGVPPAGPNEVPYELADVRQAWHLDLTGRCVKLLDYCQVYGQIPPAPAWRFVWLDRDPLQQARSQVKFLAGMGEIKLDPGTVDALAASYERTRPASLGQLRRAGELLVLRYEQVVRNPLRAARQLARLRPGLNTAAAAAMVHRRDPACRPDLAVEFSGGGHPPR